MKNKRLDTGKRTIYAHRLSVKTSIGVLHKMLDRLDEIR